MSASHHPTDVHLRQHRAKKRNKLRARIAAAPPALDRPARFGSEDVSRARDEESWLMF
jgi:hypothetical protein